MLSKFVSLRLKIMLPVVVLSAFIFLVGIIFDYQSLRKMVHEQLILRAKVLADSTQFMVETFEKPEELQRFVASFQGESGVSEVVIVSGTPFTVLAASKQKWIGLSQNLLPANYRQLIQTTSDVGMPQEFPDFEHRKFTYVLPVNISPNKVGELHFINGMILIEVASVEEFGVIVKLLIQHILMLIGCITTMIFLIYWIMQKTILRPIEMIQQSMQKRASGDTKTYVTYTANDELGLLSGHTNDLYNAMEAKKKIIEDQKDKVATSARVVALAQVSGSIAHEINNPLFIINGALYSMENQLKKEKINSPAIQDGIVKIQEMADQITLIIKGLKGLARGDHRDPFVCLKIKDVVGDTLRLYEAHLRNSGIEVRLKNISDSAEIYGQKIQLQQVLLNLISNAADAVAGLEKPWIEIAVEDVENSWQVTITDSGRGIAKEHQDKILNPFFTTKAAGKGTGLGLAIALEIARYHGGNLYLNFQHPHTQFVLRLTKYSAREVERLDALLGLKHPNDRGH